MGMMFIDLVRKSRITRGIFTTVFAIVIVAGCETATYEGDNDEKIQRGFQVQWDNLKPGIHREIQHNADGSKTPFTLYVPDSYDPGKASPLILALHDGGRMDFQYYGQGFLEGWIQPALGDLDAIVVAPDAISRKGWGAKVNEDAVIRLLDRIHEELKIDSNKTLVAGYSMGGHGTWFFANKFPDRFKAAIPIAGRPHPEMDTQIPVRAIHSNDDDRVRLSSFRSEIDKMIADGKDIELIILDGPSHFDREPHIEALKKLRPWVETVWESADD